MQAVRTPGQDPISRELPAGLPFSIQGQYGALIQNVDTRIGSFIWSCIIEDALHNVPKYSELLKEPGTAELLAHAEVAVKNLSRMPEAEARALFTKVECYESALRGEKRSATDSYIPIRIELASKSPFGNKDGFDAAPLSTDLLSVLGTVVAPEPIVRLHGAKMLWSERRVEKLFDKLEEISMNRQNWGFEKPITKMYNKINERIANDYWLGASFKVELAQMIGALTMGYMSIVRDVEPNGDMKLGSICITKAMAEQAYDVTSKAEKHELAFFIAVAFNLGDERLRASAPAAYARARNSKALHRALAIAVFGGLPKEQVDETAEVLYKYVSEFDPVKIGEAKGFAPENSLCALLTMLHQIDPESERFRTMALTSLERFMRSDYTFIVAGGYWTSVIWGAPEETQKAFLKRTEELQKRDDELKRKEELKMYTRPERLDFASLMREQQRYEARMRFGPGGGNM